MQVLTPVPQTQPPWVVPAAEPVPSQELDANLDHLRRDEQEKVDRAKAETLARIRELARLD